MFASGSSAPQVCGNRLKKIKVAGDKVDWATQGCYVLTEPNEQQEYKKIKHQYLNIEAPYHNTVEHRYTHANCKHHSHAIASSTARQQPGFAYTCLLRR